ncbi:MAG TPA: hypothetical protein PK733_02040 [Clostridiales bacterium]|nr:hypothetical protein [Clostridiales bacterium]
MKAYNEYMNKISVSGTLHQRLVSCVDETRPVHRPFMIKRYTAAFACLAVMLFGVFVMPQLMQNTLTPTPGENPSVSQSGKDMPTPDASSNYTLYFNKADAQSAADIAIPGHFWQELTDEELKAVFPALTKTHSITATANFQSDKSGASLINIDAHAVSDTGLKTYILLVPGEVVLDYGFDAETNASDVLGTPVTAGYFETNPNSKGVRNIIYFATFKLSDIAYYVELDGAEVEKEALKEELTSLIGTLIKGEAADISVFHPIIPELRNDRISLDEARADADFGSYIPETLPEGFAFESATRFINQERNTLFINWTKGMGSISWRVSLLDDNDKTRITSVTNTKNYDLALYPIPRADSVPEELREIVDNPIFPIDELTLDTVRARTYEVSDAGDESGPRMRFSVLCRDILVELSVKGASPEAMFEILQQIAVLTDGKREVGFINTREWANYTVGGDVRNYAESPEKLQELIAFPITEAASAQYSFAKLGKNGEVISGYSLQNQQLAEAIIMDSLIKFSVWYGVDITTLEESYLIRQTFQGSGETHDYYAYLLDDGTAVLQRGAKGMYSVLSQELYSELAESFENLIMDTWPENQYTEGVPKPDFGTMLWMRSDEEQGYFAVAYQQVSKEQIELYIQALMDDSWHTIHDFYENTTIGGLYEKGTHAISLQFAGNQFVMYLSLK